MGLLSGMKKRGGIKIVAKYRQVHVEFWQDGFVLDLTPEEKYFYIYLMTNSKTTQCGIYELPKRIIETETGYNRETVDKLLNRFIEYEKILYDDITKELMLVNWIRYNAINSPKVVTCIKKELDSTKNKKFIKDYIYLCKQYGYCIDTLSIDFGEEGEKDKDKEKEKEKDEEGEVEKGPETVPIHPNCFHFYENNFGKINSHISHKIGGWLENFEGQHEIVIKAMEITLERNKCQWGYSVGILKDWFSHNAKTIKEIEVYEAEKKYQMKKPFKRGLIRQEIIPDYFDKKVVDMDPKELEEKKQSIAEKLNKFRM
jgi:DnaD/phage-associated family protein